MRKRKSLTGDVVAISISESPDMAILGLAKEHIDDAMAEVSRHLLAMDAQVIYGGDLRAKGFTEILFELVSRYSREVDSGGQKIYARNFLAWPVHVNLSIEELKQASQDLEDIAELVCLTADAKIMTASEREKHSKRPTRDDEWSVGLTAMRNMMAQISNARIVLGGRVENFKGKMPGIAEEALSSFKAKKPLFLLGGFGGCAGDISAILDLAPTRKQREPKWPGQDEFSTFSKNDLNNGLTLQENEILATTIHIDQAVALILRGMLRAN